MNTRGKKLGAAVGMMMTVALAACSGTSQGDGGTAHGVGLGGINGMSNGTGDPAGVPAADTTGGETSPTPSHGDAPKGVASSTPSGAPSAPSTPPASGGSCSISTGNASCNSCLMASCCDAIAACNGNQSCVALYGCVSQCRGDSACSYQCAQQYPNGQGALQTFYSCSAEHCDSCG